MLWGYMISNSKFKLFVLDLQKPDMINGRGNFRNVLSQVTHTLHLPHMQNVSVLVEW